jgi:hypothetical protein
MTAVETAIRDLARRFPPDRIWIESWQGLSAAQSLKRLGLPVELFTPTAKSNSEQWPVLAQRLSSGTIVLPPHVRLREELLNLVYEVGPSGVKVIDRGRIHQDHAVAVRGVCAMLQQRRRSTIATVRVGERISTGRDADTLAALLRDEQDDWRWTYFGLPAPRSHYRAAWRTRLRAARAATPDNALSISTTEDTHDHGD